MVLDVRTDRYAILDAARAFLRAMKDAPEAEFDLAYQALANEVQTSRWVDTHEPRNGLVVAMQAFTRQCNHNRERGK